MEKAIPIRISNIIWLAFLLGFAIFLRWPAVNNPGFHNEDVAGITLNADLLINGYLPLVDNLEYKAPGAFFASALGWLVGGRSLITLQWMACGLALLTILGMYTSGRLIFGRSAGLWSAALYTFLSPITDSMDANYGAWMIAPYVWSFAFFILAIKRGSLRWLVATGVLLAIAGLMKRQAAVLFPLYTFVIAFSPNLRNPDGWSGLPSRRRAVFALMIGLGIGFSPIMIWYTLHGELITFIQQYFFSESGWKYVQGDLTFIERLERLGDGFRGLWKYVATPTLLASATVLIHARSSTSLSMRAILLGGYLAMGFLGATLGLRFFKSYYLQVLPALIFLSVHPQGALGRLTNFGLLRRQGRSYLHSAAVGLASAFILAPALIQDGYELSGIRTMRERPRDPASHRIGDFIRNRTQPQDRIWVWGRWGWPIYYYADRRAATHFPKSLGVFTTTLTNTWRRPTKNTAFDPKSPWQDLITQLKRDKPAFIVLAVNEDYRRFTALNKLLRSHYHTVKKLRLRGYAIHQLKRSLDK